MDTKFGPVYLANVGTLRMISKGLTASNVFVLCTQQIPVEFQSNPDVSLSTKVVGANVAKKNQLVIFIRLRPVF